MVLLGAKIKGGHSGIIFTYSLNGLKNGKAFVEFDSKDDWTTALKFNNEYMTGRRIKGDDLAFSSNPVHFYSSFASTAVVI